MNLALSPLDTCFFRDGTPFDQGDSTQVGVAGVFPPHPPTVTGALRVGLALRNGWDGRSRWSRDLQAVLGAEAESCGQLRFTGPFVLRGGAPVFPAPRHLVGRAASNGQWLPLAMLRPGRAVPSDLGPSSRLPEAGPPGAPDSGRGLQPGARSWVTLAGLKQILRGEIPSIDQVLGDRDLWTVEPRLGIAREPGSRTTKERALYSTRHARLRPGVSIGVEIQGLPEGWTSPAGSVLPLGGESRLAACESWNHDLGLDASIDGTRRFVLVALTPVLLDLEAVRGRAELPIRGARVVSACTGDPLRIGGWDSMRRAPLPLKNALAPGSTLFCELENAGRPGQEVVNGMLRLGASTAGGFGLCAVGHRPDWEEAK